MNNHIIPHFDKYPLNTKKKADFLLFKSVIELINEGKHLTQDGLMQILSIRASINLGLTNKLIESFPNVVPVQRAIVNNTEILDPNWLAGFSEGEGCFFVESSKSKSHTVGYQVRLKFQLTQHSRDSLLMSYLINYLDCGVLRKVGDRPAVDIVVTNFLNVEKKIIPFFTKYPLIGSKKLDFYDFCEAALIIKNKDHLTEEGLDKIKKIKLRMNTKRNWNS